MVPDCTFQITPNALHPLLPVHTLGFEAQIQLLYFWRYRLWHMSVAVAFSCSCCPLVLWRSAHASNASAIQQRRNIHWQWPKCNTLVLSYNPREGMFLLWLKSMFILFKFKLLSILEWLLEFCLLQQPHRVYLTMVVSLEADNNRPS